MDTTDLTKAMEDIETLATELGAEEMTIELAEMINHDADDIKVGRGSGFTAQGLLHASKMTAKAG